MTKKSTKKENKKESFFKSNNFLKLVFGLLLVLVIVLVILCIIKSKEADNSGFANMSFSIVDDKPASFGINALNLSQTDEYIFKVTNYKGDKINKKEKKYNVTIENNTDCVISVTVNDLDDNVMTNQESTLLTDTLKGGEKESVYYHVKVKSAGKLDEKDLILVKIES